MKKSGNNIKTAAEKKAQGTYRKDRDATRMETVLPPVDGIPDPPTHFDAQHKKKWFEVAGKVFKARILNDLDTDFLQSYVENWFVAEEAMRDVQKNGAVLWVEMANGSKPIRNPNHAVYVEAIKHVRQIGEKFGFSPRDRQSIKVQDKTPAKSAILEAMQGGLKKAQ